MSPPARLAPEDGRGYHPEVVTTLGLGHDLVGALAGYLEFFSLVSTELASEWEGTVDCGLMYRLTDDLQLDGGVNVVVTRAA